MAADFEADVRLVIRIPFSADGAAASFDPDVTLASGRARLVDRPAHEQRSAATEDARADVARYAETVLLELVREHAASLGEIVDVRVEGVTER